MATRMAQSATTCLLLTSLVLFNVVMTSTLPSAHPLPDVHTARTTNNNNNRAKLAPGTTDLGSVTDCPRGYFFSGVSLACTRCSKCPVNQIIRQPCSASADTKCGPFFEFSEFHQSPVENKASEDSQAQDSQDTQLSATWGSKEEDAKEEADQRAVRLERATGQWRTLAFALIAVLSFICCIVVAVGFYVCVTLRRSQTQKIVLREPELMAPQSVDTEPRYVDMYATSLRYNSRTARHLPVYQQIFTGYDVTEILPSTPLTGGDVKSQEGVNRADEGDYVSVYVNTAALETRDS